VTSAEDILISRLMARTDDTMVLLPGFQKGRDIKASQGKGQGAVLAKKGQFASYKEKLTEFHSFWGQ
jgi:hypothetical protein